MTHLQPLQLKSFFSTNQERIMQKDLVKYFTGKAKFGIHSVIMESAGKLTDYYVGFIVEQPDNPRPFIIMVVVEAKVNISKERFVAYVDDIAAKAEELPERKRALLKQMRKV